MTTSETASAHAPELEAAVVGRQRAVRQRTQIRARHEQHLIEAEIHATRRSLLRLVRRRGGSAAFCDPDFLTVADRPTLYQAILHTAVTTGGADQADLQLYDHNTATLRLVAHHGFTAQFLTFFATVDTTTPTSCATALTTRRPVHVDDITHSTIFTDRPTLEPILDAGTRAVTSYPLITTGALLGVLSFHYHTPHPTPDTTELISQNAAHAINQLP